MILGLFLSYKLINRDSLIGVIREDLPPTEAALMEGMTLGEKGDLGRDDYQNLKNSGLVHMVIVSGSNVMLIVGSVIEILALILGRKKAIVFGLGWGWYYVALVGWQVPVVRAILMVSIMYGAQLVGRKYDVWRGLALSILIILLGDIKAIAGMSFWLSITAFLGVLTGKRLGARKNCWWAPLAESAWISCWISPIMALELGKINIISPLTNWLAVVMVEMATILGILGMGIGWWWPIMGKAVLWLSLPALKYLEMIVNLSGGLNWANPEIKFNLVMTLGCYLALLGWWWKKENEKN